MIHRQLQQNFKQLNPQYTLTSTSVVFYHLIRSKTDQELLQRLKGAFAPVTNPIKLHNGADPMHSLKIALANAVGNSQKRQVWWDKKREKCGEPRVPDYNRMAQILGNEPGEGVYEQLAERLESVWKLTK